MEKHDELSKSLENYREVPNDSEHIVIKRADVSIEALQSLICEKQKLLDAALCDLAKVSDCKCCSNIGKCSTHSIERNLAYGGCGRWQWKGAEAAEKAS
ncbi:MAG: hypothetical protein KBI01_08880 [Oscillospiraceae bacterium]|nr:hypothetical protein [Oscillospiraceae bacterium]